MCGNSQLCKLFFGKFFSKSLFQGILHFQAAGLCLGGPQFMISEPRDSCYRVEWLSCLLLLGSWSVLPLKQGLRFIKISAHRKTFYLLKSGWQAWYHKRMVALKNFSSQKWYSGKNHMNPQQPVLNGCFGETTTFSTKDLEASRCFTTVFSMGVWRLAHVIWERSKKPSLRTPKSSIQSWDFGKRICRKSADVIFQWLLPIHWTLNCWFGCSWKKTPIFYDQIVW